LTLHYFRIDKIPEIPTTVKTLHIIRCQLKQLVELPPNLEELRVENIRDLQTLPQLPITLKTLVINDCRNLHMPNLPPSLQHLHVHDIYEITNILLPDSLKMIKLDQYNAKYDFTHLPSHLEILSVENAGEIIFPKKLPSTLKKLYLYRSSGFHELPELPEGLIHLQCNWSGLRYGNKKLTQLPSLPSTIEIMDVSYTPIRSLPQLPLALKKFKCDRTRITVLPPLPPNLQELECSETWLTTLPPLPSTLNWLVCKDCPLQTLPPLPASLEKMFLMDTNLTRLPRLPPKMRVMNISNTHIELLPPLPRTLNVIGMEQTPLTLIIKQREPMANYKRRWRNWWKRRESLQVEYGYVDT
jgi:hypothetical protein